MARIPSINYNCHNSNISNCNKTNINNSGTNNNNKQGNGSEIVAIIPSLNEDLFEQEELRSQSEKQIKNSPKNMESECTVSHKYRPR